MNSIRLNSVTIIVVLATLVLQQQEANATLSKLCWIDKDSAPWFPSKSTVPIWVNNSGSSSLLAATGMDTGALNAAVKRALYIWNEQSGSALNLRYMGMTSQTAITGAVVIAGDSTSCGTVAGGVAQAPSQIYNNSWVLAHIIVYKHNPACTPLTWVNVPFQLPLQVDLVGVLVHEIGHAVFNMGHPYDSLYEDCDYTPGLVAGSVMQGSSTAAPLMRDLGNYDLEIAQQRYGVRAQHSLFYLSSYNAPNWYSSSKAGGSGATPLFRMGSMPDQGNTRRFGWVDNGPGGATLRIGGAGYYYSTAGYGAAALNNWAYLWPSIGRPVAMAAQSPTGDILVAYEKPVGSTYNDSRGSIFWRRSFNGGLTWSSETQGLVTTVYGLTAGYDPYSKSFLIAFVARNASYYNQLWITIVPASGSSIPAPVSTALPYTALHAPSIACTGAANRCLLAYEQPDSIGSLTGLFVGVNPSTGVVQPVQAYVWPVANYDTPGLAFATNYNAFRIAVSSGEGTIGSYAFSNLDPNLGIFTGFVWNSPGSAVSTPVVTIRTMGATLRPEAWFLRYWQ